MLFPLGLRRGLCIWLRVVAGLRMLSVVVALTRPTMLATSVFAAAADELTALGARVFASWTLMSCSLCILCANESADPESSVFVATAFSFVIALAFFLPELANHETVTLQSAAGPLLVASISLVWMGVVRLQRTGHTTALGESAVRSPALPYYAVIFTSTRSAGDDGYAQAGRRMVELAAQSYGFMGVESAREPGGLGITVSYWRDETAIRAWKRHAEHQLAQQLGKEKWYTAYELRVAKVERAYGRRDGKDHRA